MGLLGARRRLRDVRRRIAYHRRGLAVVLTAAAVLAGLRALAPPPPDTVRVTVAARDLPAGVRLASSDLEAREFAPGSVPEGTLARPVGRVLAGALRRGEPVTGVRLVGPALARAAPGEQAVPVRLPDAGVASLLRPGDRVDLWATDPADGTTRLLATGVRILAVPQVDEAATAAGKGALVVVSVSPSRVPIVAGASLSEFLTVAFGR